MTTYYDNLIRGFRYYYKSGYVCTTPGYRRRKWRPKDLGDKVAEYITVYFYWASSLSKWAWHLLLSIWILSITTWFDWPMSNYGLRMMSIHDAATVKRKLYNMAFLMWRGRHVLTCRWFNPWTNKKLLSWKWFLWIL